MRQMDHDNTCISWVRMLKLKMPMLISLWNLVMLLTPKKLQKEKAAEVQFSSQNDLGGWHCQYTCYLDA
jgi:hypothetical protein